jgi:UDP-GlcNAc:undecaprenyl-phosphate/decaprenyl-phosphate GlcNAc-1-phosphate transferase
VSLELSTTGSFAAAAAVSLAATPLAIRVANRTDFLDRPRDYKRHATPTPLLGGAAVLAAFMLTTLLVAGATGRLLVPLGCAAALWLIGTIDDAFGVAPKWRLLAAAAAGAALYGGGLGWDTSLPGAVDCGLTIVSVVIAVNAFNLMDNLDGACCSVGAMAAAGIGVLAAIKGQTVVAPLAFALAGACAGFLVWNLASPARIFLGDGGSMPIGFVMAALAIATTRHAVGGNAGLLVAALLVGLPIFDATLVSYSRIRRGVSIVTGDRDHLSHRLLLSLDGPRSVASALAALQAFLCAVAIGGYELGAAAVTGVALTVFVLAVPAILVLDSARWRPAGIAVAASEHSAPGAARTEEA